MLDEPVSEPRAPLSDQDHQVLVLPSLRAAMRHSRAALLEGVVAPFALFYLVLMVTGLRGACIAGLGWSCLALLRRCLRRERVPATLLLGTVMLAGRTVVTLVTGSAFVYFVQPTLGTALMALLFLVTALVRRPLIERLARDFCPLDPEFFHRRGVRRFFRRLSVLWGMVLLFNAGCVMWLLLTSSLRAFVLERTLLSWTLTLAGILASIFWFIRAMRRERLRVRFTGSMGAGATPVS